ncbi:MAG: hypothetical protein QXW79_01035 [Thermoplasmata archaeon]
MSNRSNKKNLITDRSTDYLFDYFINEDKFNEQLRGEWDEQMEKKLENHREPKLDSRIDVTEKKTEKKIEGKKTSSEKNTSSADFESDDNTNNSTNSGSVEEDKSERISTKSPLVQKSASKPVVNHAIKQISEKKQEHISERPLLGEKLVGNVQKYAETPEEKRSRARDEYSKLQDLVEKYGVTLTRQYSIDDDPDEMRAEYEMHRARRNKNNQVKFYKQILLNIVCGIEFLNEKYDPFAFKLKDWSKQIATDMDDYTEVLEEIYEKYKNKGGKMAPEIKLLFMIIVSGVTYHLSQSLFGSGGLDQTIKNNPNLINKLLGTLMNGKITGNTVPTSLVDTPHDNKSILEAIKKHNQNKNSNDHMETNHNDNLEREKKILEEQKAQFENQVRKQNELIAAQLEQLRNEQQLLLQRMAGAQAPAQPVIKSPTNKSPAVRILSDVTKKPRFMENSVSNNHPKEDLKNIFDTEVKDEPKSSKQKSSTKECSQNDHTLPNKKNLDELIETLEESTDVDIDDIIETSVGKRSIQPITSSKKPNKKTENRSDVLSISKKNIIKL